ncbi:hypothetical protein LXL04_029594 [Taraxacum kok-saghyz]
MGYTDLFLPQLIVHILTLLGVIHSLISSLFSFIGLKDIFHPISQSNAPQSELPTQFQTLSAVLLRELLPVVKFTELVDPPETCVVCLYEFDAGDEIRVLTNCRHVFHRCCVDRWMDHDRKTCPLCRTPFISEDLQDSFNERLWAASGFADYYGESSLAGTS